MYKYTTTSTTTTPLINLARDNPNIPKMHMHFKYLLLFSSLGQLGLYELLIMFSFLNLPLYACVSSYRIYIQAFGLSSLTQINVLNRSLSALI